MTRSQYLIFLKIWDSCFWQQGPQLCQCSGMIWYMNYCWCFPLKWVKWPTQLGLLQTNYDAWHSDAYTIHSPILWTSQYTKKTKHITHGTTVTYMYHTYTHTYMDGLVQKRSNSIASALVLRLSWTYPSICVLLLSNTIMKLRWFIIVA